MPSNSTADQAKITSGGSLSSAINLGGGNFAGLFFPAAWDAAALTFQGSLDGVTYANIYDEFGTEKSITVTAAVCVPINPREFSCFNYIKLRSGTAASPVNQTADRLFSPIVRMFV